MKKRHLFILILITHIFTAKVGAIPEYRLYFSQNYDLETSCKICHETRGGSKLNKYGIDFKRGGERFRTFADIAKKDSDKDGISNLDEIRNASNPGSKFSTPNHPGPWLVNMEANLIPFKHLRKAFPKARGFTLVNQKLSDIFIKSMEEKLNRKFKVEDYFYVYYLPAIIKSGKRIRNGAATFVRTPEFTLLMGINLDSEITYLKLINAKNWKLKKAKWFFKQFKTRRPADPIAFGIDLKIMSDDPALSERIRLSVEQNLKIMAYSFTGIPE